MKHADFIHLVRLSEHDSAADSAAYRRAVTLFAALGYAWVIGCAVLACATLWWVGTEVASGRIRASWLWLIAFALGLLWSSLRALWLRLEPPAGETLTPQDAPLLFAALEKIRLKINGPVIHHVVLNEEFNACISQLPRYGLFGGAVNYLSVGLPLLLALDRRRLLAVLAHEYGHLRGDHGRLSAWTYRTRVTWLKLYQSLSQDAGAMAALTQAFFRWYFPRFAARTFALARQDEYEADRVSSNILGAEVTAAALVELEVKSAWMERVFWVEHWRRAAAHAAPPGPFRELAQRLAQSPDGAFAQDALRQAMRRLADVDDTHPVLRDRLESLEQSARLPPWSHRSALALLGPNASLWVDQFDRQWCKNHAGEWKQHHAFLRRMQARINTLLESIGRNSANEMVELAQLQTQLDPEAPVRSHYERALAITPNHAGALRGMAMCLPPEAQALRLTCLQTLFDTSVAHRWWACSQAVQTLEAQLPNDPQVEQILKPWRERLRQADELERRAQQEHLGTPFFSAITRDDLSEYEKEELLADLSRHATITRAWLVCKNLREFAQRRCYTLFVELPGMDDESRFELCRDLERSLTLPGPVLVLWAGYSPTLQEIERNAFNPVFVRVLR